jgi:hypothetical protein
MLVGIALALGLAVEILFYGHTIGISFPIWAALGVAAILIASRMDGIRPAAGTLALIPGILFFAAIAAIRLEPLTVMLSMMATLLLFGLFVRALLHGRLHRYGFIDLAFTWLTVPIEAILRPWPTLSVTSRQVTGDRVAQSRLFAVLRGLLLAIPVLIVLVALLATADLVFGDLVEDALAWVDLERIAEYIGRGLVVLVSGIFFLGALITALRAREPRELIGEEQPILKPFVGAIESAVVLGLVVLVFAVFGAIQFRYLFGGEVNIAVTGYTYSEYARRGFGELVWAAFLCLSLIFALGHWSRRNDVRQRWVFIGLSSALVLMVGVALASALMRLRLYENAFGFTRLRTYTHIFIFWLAALLVAFLVLLYLGHLRAFAPIVVGAGLGFIATLALMNVDGFIADRNLARFERTDDLDAAYLGELSPDSLPAIAAWMEGAQYAPPAELVSQVACESGILAAEMADSSWQSFHVGRERAQNSVASIGDELSGHQAWMDGMIWLVSDSSGQEEPCLGMWRD